jgi:quercetin dioxygenase-like cupin family protein
MDSSNVKVTPWLHEQPVSESAILQRFRDEGLSPYSWSNRPGDVYAAHSHNYNKVIYVVRGTIQFGLPDTGTSVSLQAGDRLDLPAGVRHDATVGNQGVTCLEAHR